MTPTPPLACQARNSSTELTLLWLPMGMAWRALVRMVPSGTGEPTSASTGSSGASRRNSSSSASYSASLMIGSPL